ncbi:hypothetical protein MMC07_009531 [Pseudocyphellaria aurata]|nr:hypothetical protein [Pseudocyphellaria aurata]
MAALNINSKYVLSTGHEIPILGFGVYQTSAAVAEDVVLQAFKAGYRHVDSARVYRNEGPCADAIKKSGIPRSEIFFTSKVPPWYLIHAPYGGKEARTGAWRALVEAQREGKIRSLGVSNYGVHHLDELEAYIQELEQKHGEGRGGKISVGQWELHPWLARPDIVEWCQKRGIILQAYSPLVRGQRFNEPSLQQLVKKYSKTAAQILLRWSLQKGFVPLPKSATHSRILENADVFDFALTPQEVATLQTKDYSPCTWDPTTSHD